jgi:hypothetical protein
VYSDAVFGFAAKTERQPVPDRQSAEDDVEEKVDLLFQMCHEHPGDKIQGE